MGLLNNRQKPPDSSRIKRFLELQRGIKKVLTLIEYCGSAEVLVMASGIQESDSSGYRRICIRIMRKNSNPVQKAVSIQQLSEQGSTDPAHRFRYASSSRRNAVCRG